MNSSQNTAERDHRLETAADWLLRLREETLTEAEMTEWIDWCESSPANLEAFAEVQSLWRAAGEHRMPDSQPILRRHILQTRVPLWSALAASIVVLAVASVILLTTSARRQLRQPTLIPLATRDFVQTPLATNRQALLPDGSQIEIGARTAVDVDFTAPHRRLRLREGEAFFKVKHDTARPFIVEAGHLQITAIGTAFDVRRASNEIAVTVEEGVVEAKEGAAPAVRVRAGEQLLFQNGSTVRRSLIDPAVALAWRSGRLEYAGDSLESVIANVNRYSARPIVLTDPALRELTFTGTIFLTSINAWLDGLQQVFPIDVDQDGDGAIAITPHKRSP